MGNQFLAFPFNPGSKMEQSVGAHELREEVTGSNAAWAISDYLFKFSSHG